MTSEELARKNYTTLLKFCSPKYDEEKHGYLPENLLDKLNKARDNWIQAKRQ